MIAAVNPAVGDPVSAAPMVKIAPSWTPMLAGMPQEVQDSLAATLPFPKRLGKPEEFGMMVDQMVRNPILNGEVIRLDCALRMAPK